MLFSHDPSSPAFKAMAAQLAWIGTRAGERTLLERDIFALTFSDDYSIERCDLWKDIGKAGKYISPDSPEAHIPIEEFIYRSYINGN